MKSFVKKYANNITSQNGENGIIEEVLKRIGLYSGIAVEFGAPTKDYCSNIHPLEGAWAKRYYDVSPSDPDITKAEINPGNVNDIITPNADVLSIDIDGNDFNVWKAYKGKPAIVIIEINSSLDPDVEFFHPDRGSSFCTMNRLANDKGYFLLCHTGNCVYIDLKYQSLFPEINLIVTSEKFFNNSWLKETYETSSV
jgi:hypothetical protein